MKAITCKFFCPLFLFFSLALAASNSVAQVYKVVDENGNVTYTDQAPKDGSPPIQLKPLSVIEAPVYEQAPKNAGEAAEADEPEQMSLGYLRRNYSDFAIVAPQPEESIWQPERAVTVAWNTRYALQEGMQVTIFLDGAEFATTRDQIISLPGMDRGEHTVSAELRDAGNRSIATAEPVVFFIRRPGLYNRANGGG